MKTKITALALITATALFHLLPKPAAASDKGLALVGGFLGGLIVASAINDSRHDDYYPARNTTVVVNDRCDDRGSSGYWKEVSIRFLGARMLDCRARLSWLRFTPLCGRPLFLPQ